VMALHALLLALFAPPASVLPPSFATAKKIVGGAHQP
jgi:hypothetical protein